MNSSRIRMITQYAILTALGFILGWLESLLPNPLEAIAPGIKLGLANLVVMITLYRFGGKAAIVVSLLRILLTAFTFGNLSMMFYSLAGAALSLLVMLILRSFRKFSPVGISMAGGIAHNLGQILLAMIILGESLFYYLPFLLASGFIGGILVGLLCVLILQRIPKKTGA